MNVCYPTFARFARAVEAFDMRHGATRRGLADAFWRMLKLIGFGAVATAMLFARSGAAQETPPPAPDPQLQKEWKLFAGGGSADWVPNERVRSYVQILDLVPIEYVEFDGPEMGCIASQDHFRIYDASVIASLKQGLLHAWWPNVSRSQYGREEDDGIRFVFRLPGFFASERFARTAHFHPWFSITSHGPEFWAALKHMSHFYARQTRADTMKVPVDSVERIELSYAEGEDSMLESQEAIKEYLAKATTIDDSCYDATARDRFRIKSVIYQRGNKQMTRFFLIPKAASREQGSFTQMLYRYAAKDSSIQSGF